MRGCLRGCLILFSVLLLLLGLLIAIPVGFYFKGLPWISSALIEFVPAEYETQIGDEALTEINDSYESLPILSEKVQIFYNGLNFGEGNKIQVIDAPFFNAFALPNHTILITTTALKKLQSHEELAALLAHEHIHNAQHHVLKNLLTYGSRWMMFEILLGEQNNYDMSAVVNQLSNLKNSRDSELEADEKGLALLVSKGLDANAMIQLMNTMKQMEQGDPNSLEKKYFRTHPHTDDRIKALETQLSQIRQNPGRKPELEDQFQEIQALVNSSEEFPSPVDQKIPEEELEYEPNQNEEEAVQESPAMETDSMP